MTNGAGLVGRFAPEVVVDAPNGEVHRRQPPGGGGLLPVDGHVSHSFPPWASMNISDCTNMPPEPQQGLGVEDGVAAMREAVELLAREWPEDSPASAVEWMIL